MSGDFSVDRIAGEALLMIDCEDGVVKNAYFIPVAPIRGFEKLVKGKNPLFVIEAVKRICGFCHSAHGIAAAEAFEDALGIYPPKDGLLLREVIGLLNRVQSHILHTILISPDVLGCDRAYELTLKLIAILEKVNSALARVGGSPTHPPNIVIGGVSKAPSKANVSTILNLLKAVRSGFSEVVGELMDEGRWCDKALRLKERHLSSDVLATHLTYGDRYSLDLSKLEIKRYDEVHADVSKPQFRTATSLIALYDGKVVEVGPRARMQAFKGFNSNSLMGVEEARLNEVFIAIDRVTNLLSEVNVKAPVTVRGITFREGEGVGVYEAPRGTLLHRVKLGGDGRVSEYSIVVPTEFLIPVIEGAARGIPINYVDVVPRIFDPCIPCTTHVIMLGEGG